MDCPSPVGPTRLRRLGTSNGCQNHTPSPYAATSFVCVPLIAHGFWLNAKPALPSRVTPNAAASTASRPASLTIRIRPSVGRDGEGYIPESGEVKTGIFLMNGLDRQFADLPVGQSAERALDNPEPPSTREPDHTGQYGPVDNNLPPRNSWPSKAASAVWSYYAMN